MGRTRPDQPIGLRAKAVRHDVTLGGAKYLYSVTQSSTGAAPFEKTWEAPHPRVSGGVEPVAGHLAQRGT